MATAAACLAIVSGKTSFGYSCTWLAHLHFFGACTILLFSAKKIFTGSSVIRESLHGRRRHDRAFSRPVSISQFLYPAEFPCFSWQCLLWFLPHWLGGLFCSGLLYLCTGLCDSAYRWCLFAWHFIWFYPISILSESDQWILLFIYAPALCRNCDGLLPSVRGVMEKKMPGKEHLSTVES